MSIKIRQITKERVKIQLITFSLLILLSGSNLIDQSPNIFYFAKSSLYSWAGDIRLIINHSYPITHHQISIVCQQLQPGDIILTRRNGFVSNLFIPGYWTHSALYIGPEAEANFTNDPCVIEALSEGVTLRTLEESLQANAFIIFRPIVLKEDIDLAIENAFSQIGKPYDYDFDFSTHDKLSCTELIYRSYEHAQIIIVQDLFGRLFTTPNDIIEDYNNQKGFKNQKLKFVLQMDEKGVIEINNDKLLAETVKFSHLDPR